MKKIVTLLTMLLALVIYVSAQEGYTGAEKPANHQNTQYQGNGSRDWTGCLPCAIPEGEADIPDGGTDTVNGGCNYDPPRFTSIQIGDVFCGRGNQYNNYGTRDLDWYRIVLTEPKTLYWSVIANFYTHIQMNGNIGGPCNGQYGIAFSNVEPGTVGTISGNLAPGEYYFIVAPVGWGPGLEGDYMVTLTEQPPQDPWCSGVVPISNWALYIGIGLILVFAFVRFRKMV